MATAMLVCTVAGNMGLISPFYLALLWPQVLKKFEVSQTRQHAQPRAYASTLLCMWWALHHVIHGDARS